LALGEQELCACNIMDDFQSLCRMSRAGQNRMYTPYMTVCMVISLPKILYMHRVYL